MSSPPAARSRSRKRLLAEVALLVLCSAAALFLWLSRRQNEERLQRATREQLLALTQREPSNPRAHYFLGLRHREAGSLPEAVAAFQKAAELDADNEDAWIAWARGAETQGDTQQAFSILRVFLKSHPENVNGLLALAAFYHNQDAIKRAHETAVQATKIDPKNVRAWRRVATEALELKLYPEAEAALLKSIALVPEDWRSHSLLGIVYARQRRDKEALASLQKSAALAPTEATPVRERGKIELSSARDEAEVRKAIETLQRSLQMAPDDGSAVLAVGKGYMRLNDWPAARKALEQATTLLPNDPAPYFDLAAVYLKLGDTTRSKAARRLHADLEAYRTRVYNLQSLIYQVADDVPRNNRLRRELARLYASRQDFALALREYQHLRVRTPDDTDLQREIAAVQQQAAQAAPRAAAAGSADTLIEPLLQEGDRLRQEGRFGEAKRVYAQALTKAPRSAPGYLGLGLSLLGENNEPDAFRAFNRAVEIDPNLDAAQFELAKIYLNMGFADEAIRRVLALLKKDPGNAAGQNLVGLGYQKVDVRGQAEAYFARAVALDPQNIDYLINLAYAEARNGKFDGAEKHYREAVARAPQNGLLLAFFGSFLAERFEATHQPEKAREAEDVLKRSLSLAPRNFTAVFGLGNLALSRNAPRDALPYLQTAVELRPDLVPPWYRLSLAYTRAGDKEKAERYRRIFRQKQDYFDRRTSTEMLARERSKDPDLRLKLARIYAEGGDKIRAVNQYQMCLALDPKNAAARKEAAALMDALRRSGQLPSIEAFNRLIASSTAANANSTAANAKR